MIIGVPKEIKNHEYRVGLTPESVTELTRDKHQVLVENNAGIGIGASDADYQLAGAHVVGSADTVFDGAEMIVKVKEPLAVERAKLKPEHVLFTYLHLAPDRPQAEDLVKSGATCIAYETVTDERGQLPLLKPMSQVAGRLSVQAGAAALEISNQGRGVLLGGVPGVAPADVVIIGGGVVGFHAAQMAIGMQANVTILDRDPEVLDRLSAHFGATARVLYSSEATLRNTATNADLIIGAVLLPGAKAPKLVSKPMLKDMRPGSVLVDVAIDQGGCFETSKPTTHADPVYVVDDIVHYCVANMPGCVARTSTYALNTATLKHVKSIANQGWRGALAQDPHLANGLNVWDGKITCPAVANALDMELVEFPF